MNAEKIKKDLLITLASALAASLSTYYIPLTLSDDDLELEFSPLVNEKFINVPDLLRGRVEVLVDGHPQSNLSIIEVYLFNRPHKAFNQ